MPVALTTEPSVVYLKEEVSFKMLADSGGKYDNGYLSIFLRHFYGKNKEGQPNPIATSNHPLGEVINRAWSSASSYTIDNLRTGTFWAFAICFGLLGTGYYHLSQSKETRPGFTVTPVTKATSIPTPTIVPVTPTAVPPGANRSGPQISH